MEGTLLYIKTAPGKSMQLIFYDILDRNLCPIHESLSPLLAYSNPGKTSAHKLYRLELSTLQYGMARFLQFQ
jgi:hypothetical protein